MASFIDFSKNYSFFAIPAAFVLALVPGTAAKALAVKQYDPATPRRFIENVSKADDIDKVTKNRIQRYEWAGANAFETLPLFAGAVIAANMTGVPAESINTLSLSYLGLRVLYSFVYMILQDNKRTSPLRSLSWMAGVACWFTLYVKAGFKALEASS